MRQIIYYLELVNYDHYDEIEQVDVEDRYIIGYFNDKKMLQQAVSLCEEKKLPNEEIRIYEIEFECGPNQKYVYVLNFEYTILHNNEFSDYYEWFDPLSNYQKCIILKEQLLKEEKYRRKEYIFEDYTSDGFFIDKIKINFISHINYNI